MNMKISNDQHGDPCDEHGEADEDEDQDRNYGASDGG